MAEKQVKPSKKGDIIKVILALLAVLMGTYIFVDPGKVDYQPDIKLINKIDSLENVNAVLEKINQDLDSTVMSYQSAIDILDVKVNDLIRERKKLTEYYKDRSDDISDDSPSDIDTFFMSRYEYVTDSE